MATEHPECPNCICGTMRLQWSDRETFVRLSDPEDVAGAVIACALDHSYDRTPSGVPYGLDEATHDALAPVVDKHLSAVRPDWRKHTIEMDAEASEAFRRDLVAALRVIE